VLEWVHARVGRYGCMNADRSAGNLSACLFFTCVTTTTITCAWRKERELKTSVCRQPESGQQSGVMPTLCCFCKCRDMTGEVSFGHS
jgi:hypothetical protein